MRPLAFAVLAIALLGSGCDSPCRDLGDRLCNCKPAGQTKASCEDGVKADVDRLDPSSEVEGVCDRRLETCNAPAGIEFCDWIEGRCGKAACGLSEEKIQDLRAADPPICP